jgi:hypothetical protein
MDAHCFLIILQTELSARDVNLLDTRPTDNQFQVRARMW